jgi:hypothetical protein
VFEKEMEMWVFKYSTEKACLEIYMEEMFQSKGPFKLPDLISLSFFCLPFFFFLAELAIQFPGYENRHAEEEILTHVMCNQ